MSATEEVAAVDEAIDVGSVPPITHEEWSVLAATEFERVIDLLRQLTPEEWRRPRSVTCGTCARWWVTWSAWPTPRRP